MISSETNSKNNYNSFLINENNIDLKLIKGNKKPVNDILILNIPKLKLNNLKLIKNKKFSQKKIKNWNLNLSYYKNLNYSFINSEEKSKNKEFDKLEFSLESIKSNKNSLKQMKYSKFNLKKRKLNIMDKTGNIKLSKDKFFFKSVDVKFVKFTNKRIYNFDNINLKKNNKDIKFGVIKWDNENYYKGYIKKNLPHGKGTIIKKNYVFNGKFVKGLANGKCKYNINHLYFKGNYQDDIKNGLGKEISKNDLSVYTGEYFNNKKNGFGNLSIDNKIYYSGMFYNNKFNGFGSLTKIDEYHYQGNFYNHFFNGFGVLINLKSLSKFTGNFLKGYKNGTGKFYINDIWKYKGNWKKDEKHGEGISLIKNKYVKCEYYYGTLVRYL